MPALSLKKKQKYEPMLIRLRVTVHSIYVGLTLVAWSKDLMMFTQKHSTMFYETKEPPKTSWNLAKWWRKPHPPSTRSTTGCRKTHACGKGTTLQSLLDLICSQGASWKCSHVGYSILDVWLHILHFMTMWNHIWLYRCVYIQLHLYIIYDYTGGIIYFAYNPQHLISYT